MPKIVLCYDLEEDSDYTALKDELKETYGFKDQVSVTTVDKKSALRHLPNTTLVHSSKTKEQGSNDFKAACKGLSIKWTSYYVAEYDTSLVGNA